VEHLLSNESRASTDVFALYTLADIHHKAKRYEKAVEVCDKTLKGSPNSLEVLLMQAKCMMLLEDHAEASLVLEKAKRIQGQSILMKGQPAHVKDAAFRMELVALSAECEFEQGRPNEAVALINEVMSHPAANSSVPILLAYAYFALRYQKYEEPTRALLKAVVCKGDHPRVKELLAQLMSVPAGMKEILSQVPPVPDSQISSSSSFQERKGKCDVYGFLGYIAKCHSVISSSIHFYELALRMIPTSVNSALSVVHMHEIACDYDGALDVFVQFCEANPTMTVGSSVTCSDVLNIIISCSASTSLSTAAVNNFMLRWIQVEDTYGYMHVGPAAPVVYDKKTKKVKYSDAELDLLALYATMVKVLFLQGRLAVLPALFQLLEPCRMQSHVPLHETTIRNEMAYFQEISQLLCQRHAGQLYGLSSSTASAAAAAAASSSSMATAISTAVGNANANTTPDSSSSSSSSASSFDMQPHLLANIPAGNALSANKISLSKVRSAIAEATSRSAAPGSDASNDESSPPTPALSADNSGRVLFETAAGRPIYFCGDSHCVPPAWSILQVHGTPRLICPRLATGVKQWHMRKESRFYPKTHFYNMIHSIPDGAEVVLLIGEIDCREGFVQAVERDYYQTHDAAIQATLKEFLPVLKQLVTQKKFTLYIHPVVPVLDVTRAMVMKFNKAYRKAVEGLKLKGVHWLDIFDLLVEPVATSSHCSSSHENAPTMAQQQQLSSTSNAFVLKDKYKFDGTHLSPLYLELVEAALSKV